jgi:hypothetical protein
MLEIGGASFTFVGVVVDKSGLRRYSILPLDGQIEPF